MFIFIQDISNKITILLICGRIFHYLNILIDSQHQSTL